MITGAEIGIKHQARAWKWLCGIYIALAAVVPAVSLYIVHGSRAAAIAASHPHYFIFQTLVCPFAAVALGSPLTYLWRCVLNGRGKAVLIALPILIASWACWYDYAYGVPALLEFRPEVQDDSQLSVGDFTLWQYFESAEDLAASHPGLPGEYSARLDSLARDGLRSWFVLPYYVGLFAQVVFSIVLVLSIGCALGVRDIFLQEKNPSAGLIVSCWLSFIWLPLQISFITFKRTLYGDEGATAVIALLGIIILFFMLLISTSLVRRTNEKIFSFTISMMAAGFALLSPIYSSSTGVAELFARRWPLDWYLIIFFFSLLFRLPASASLKREKL